MNALMHTLRRGTAGGSRRKASRHPPAPSCAQQQRGHHRNNSGVVTTTTTEGQPAVGGDCERHGRLAAAGDEVAACCDGGARSCWGVGVAALCAFLMLSPSCTSGASRAHLGCISGASRAHLGRISGASRAHLGCISGVCVPGASGKSGFSMMSPCSSSHQSFLSNFHLAGATPPAFSSRP